jgi:hypothetical protein
VIIPGGDKVASHLVANQPDQLQVCAGGPEVYHSRVKGMMQMIGLAGVVVGSKDSEWFNIQVGMECYLLLG